jgi:hypothetical protein
MKVVFPLLTLLATIAQGLSADYAPITLRAAVLVTEVAAPSKR